MSRRATPLTATSEPSLSLSAKTIPQEILSAFSTPNPPYSMPSLQNHVKQTQSEHTEESTIGWATTGDCEESLQQAHWTHSFRGHKVYSSLELENHLFSFSKNWQTESMKRSVQRLKKLYAHRWQNFQLPASRAREHQVLAWKTTPSMPRLNETKDAQPRNALGKGSPSQRLQISLQTMKQITKELIMSHQSFLLLFPLNSC